MVLKKLMNGTTINRQKFNIGSLTNTQKDTRKRILTISYQKHLSHIGSCLGAVDLIDAIYKIKKNKDKFILSNGHAGIAFYVILEKYGLIKNSKTLEGLHIHPDRNLKIGIEVSTGSLGQGLPIALGMAMTNRKINIYCMVSDGECTEGSVWETLRLASDNQINNLIVIVNANGWSGYGSVSFPNLIKRFIGFGYVVKTVNGHNINSIVKTLNSITENKPTIIFAKTSTNQFPFLEEQDAHYCTMSKADYQKTLELLK